MEGNLRYLPPFFAEPRGSFGRESEAETAKRHNLRLRPINHH